MKVSRLAINMEGGFQTNKEVEFEEEVAIVVLPSMEKIEVKNCILSSFHSVLSKF